MANPLSNIFQSLELKKIFAKKETSAVALDFGISSVKVVQLRKERGKAVLETYGELSTGPYGGFSVGQSTNLSVAKLAELTGDLLKEANITSKNAAISIPLRSSLIVSVEIPQMDEEKLAEVVPIEARKYVPVPISEVVLDWWVLPTNSQLSAPLGENDEGVVKGQEEKKKETTYGKKMEVLIAAIHKDTIKQYQEVCQKVGLEVDTFEIETFSEIRSVMPNDLSATAILDIGAGTSKIAVVDYGIVRLSHTIDKGSQDITVSISKSLSVPFAKAEEIKRKIGLTREQSGNDLSDIISPTVEYIFAEANKVMLNYQKEHRRAIDKIILVGSGSLLKGVAEIGKEETGVPVALGLPFDKVEAPVFLSNILKEAGPAFAVSLGLALRKLEEI